MTTFRQLTHALALRDHGNFRRAAVSQQLSQPAFSRSVQKLEDSLGVLLFERLQGRVIPTAYGEVLLRKSETILREKQEMESEIQLVAGSGAGELHVAMGEHAAILSGSRAIGELIAQHPGLRIQSHKMSWRAVGREVLDRRADVGLAEISTLVGDSRLQLELVGSHEVAFFCRPEHPLANHSHVARSDLDLYPIATTRMPARVAELFPGKSEIDLETGDLIPAIEVNDPAMSRQIAALSNAIGLDARPLIEPSLARGELKVLAFREPWMRLQYGFITLRDRTPSPAAEAFMQAVRRIEAKLVKRNRGLTEPRSETQRGGLGSY